MRKKKNFLLIFFFLSLIKTVSAQTNVDSSMTKIDTSIYELWNKVIANNLADTALWEQGKAYNTGHFYMVPLHAAFQLNENDWQQQFANHFKKFTNQGVYETEPQRLYRLQYYYLASWFLILASQNQKDSLIPENLYSFIHDEIDWLWNMESAWTWTNKLIPVTSFKNMKDRVLWKLLNVDLPPKTYYRAIIDEEKFVFAIAANLKTYLKLQEADTMPNNEVIDDILQVNLTVWQRRTEWDTTTGGWLFQPGFWNSHFDYAYAGNFNKDNPTQKPLSDNIGEDVSHSHRTALWLQSFIAAYDSANATYFKKLLSGLNTQFFSKVIVQPTDTINTYLTKNFMNGNNGLYRWNFYENTALTGFGPFELSGTMLLGWWRFLNTAEIIKVYESYSKSFPLPENILSIYEARTGSPRPADKKPNFYINGLGELICKLTVLLQ